VSNTGISPRRWRRCIGRHRDAAGDWIVSESIFQPGVFSDCAGRRIGASLYKCAGWASEDILSLPGQAGDKSGGAAGVTVGGGGEDLQKAIEDGITRAWELAEY